MIETLRNRNFSLVWFAGLISTMGNYMLFVALPVYIYQTTQSTLATSIMFAAGIIPRLLVGAVSGVFVDRWDRKKTMVITNVLMGLTLLPLLLVRSAEQVWIIYIVQFLEAGISQFFAPAEGALLPQLVNKERLLSANSLYSLNNSISRLIGPALGGLILGSLQLGGIVLIDSATFFIAALLVAFIQLPQLVKEEKPADEAGFNLSSAVSKVWHEWMDGFRMIRGDKQLVIMFLVVGVPQIGEGVLSTLFAPFVTRVLGGTEVDFGYVISAQAIGGLLGSLIVGSMVKRVSLYKVLAAGGFLLGMIDLIIFNYIRFAPNAGVLPAIVLMAIVGVPAVAYGMAFTTMLQTFTSDQYRGRVLAAFGAASALMQLVGTLLAGAFGETSDIVLIMTIDCIGYMFMSLLGLYLFGRAARQQTYDQPETIPAGD